jgi:hypothetical protein
MLMVPEQARSQVLPPIRILATSAQYHQPRRNDTLPPSSALFHADSLPDTPLHGPSATPDLTGISEAGV